MTENQRLRALLKGVIRLIDDRACMECSRNLLEMYARIDAVLAKQSDVDQDSFMLGADKMRAEAFWMLSSRYGRFGISETLECAMEVRALPLPLLPKEGE